MVKAGSLTGDHSWAYSSFETSVGPGYASKAAETWSEVSKTGGGPAPGGQCGMRERTVGLPGLGRDIGVKTKPMGYVCRTYARQSEAALRSFRA